MHALGSKVMPRTHRVPKAELAGVGADAAVEGGGRLGRERGAQVQRLLHAEGLGVDAQARCDDARAVAPHPGRAWKKGPRQNSVHAQNLARFCFLPQGEGRPCSSSRHHHLQFHILVTS